MRNIINVFWSTIMSTIERTTTKLVGKATTSNSLISESLAKKKMWCYAVFLSYQGKNYHGMQVC